jgi:hypothetical protein
VDGQHGQQGQRHVHPEDAPPRAEPHRERRTVQRPEQAAELLRPTDEAEHLHPAPLVEQVADQRHRDRQQCPAGQALQRAPGSEHVEVLREGGQHRTGEEPGQAELDDHAPAEPVGEAAQQRHARHVPQQVPGDDRGRPLQMVDRDVEVRRDRGQHRQHDVGVERGEQHRDGARPDREAAPAYRRLGGGGAHHRVERAGVREH